MQVNILEARNRLSQLIKAARAGEEVVIANRGEPVARLVPARVAEAAAVTAVTSADAATLYAREPAVKPYHVSVEQATAPLSIAPLATTPTGITPPSIPGGPLKWLRENPLPAYARRSAAEIDAGIEAERNSWD